MITFILSFILFSCLLTIGYTVRARKDFQKIIGKKRNLSGIQLSEIKDLLLNWKTYSGFSSYIGLKQININNYIEENHSLSIDSLMKLQKAYGNNASCIRSLKDYLEFCDRVYDIEVLIYPFIKNIDYMRYHIYTKEGNLTTSTYAHCKYSLIEADLIGALINITYEYDSSNEQGKE